MKVVERTSLRMRWIATEGRRLISGLDDQSSFPRSYLLLSPFLPFLQTMSMCTPWFHRGKDSVRECTNEQRHVLRTYVFVKPCSSLHHGFTEAETASGRRAKRNATCTNTTRSTTYVGILYPVIFTPRFHRGRDSVREYNNEKRNVHKHNNEHPLSAIPSVVMKARALES